MQTAYAPLIDLDLAEAVGVLADLNTQKVFHSLLRPNPVSVYDLATSTNLAVGTVSIKLVRLVNAGLAKEDGDRFSMTAQGSRVFWGLTNSRI